MGAVAFQRVDLILGLAILALLFASLSLRWTGVTRCLAPPVYFWRGCPDFPLKPLLEQYERLPVQALAVYLFTRPLHNFYLSVP